MSNSRLRDDIFDLSKISARSLEFYSEARANKVIKLFIIWLQIGKAEIERTSTFSVAILLE